MIHKITPKHGKDPNRKTLILLISILTALLAALLLILLLTDWLNPSPKTSALSEIGDLAIPDTEDTRAMRYTLQTAEDAQAYGVRLLESGYIGLQGQIACSAELVDGSWRMQAIDGGGSEAAVVFDTEGVVTSVAVGAGTEGTPAPFQPDDREAVIAFLRDFAYAYLPDITIDSGYITENQHTSEGRFITCRTANRLADPAHEFVLQVEPVLRIVAFRLLADEDLALIRVSRSADADAAQPAAGIANPSQDEVKELALQAIVQAYDIPEHTARAYEVVDITRYTNLQQTWYGYTPAVPYWMVSFRMPGADDRVYSDYDVLIDAATGEILMIFDPSNNSNG